MPDLDDAFDTFTRDATRIEALPSFQIAEEAPALATAREGKRPDLKFLRGWHEYLDEVSASGRTSRRLRLISNPMTEYERFEVRWGYTSNAEHGEEIRLLSRSMSPEMKDYWIFDGKSVFQMLYGPDGSFIGSQAVVAYEAGDVVSWLTVAWPTATPLTDYPIEE
jgi:hypothetical protein